MDGMKEDAARSFLRRFLSSDHDEGVEDTVFSTQFRPLFGALFSFLVQQKRNIAILLCHVQQPSFVTSKASTALYTAAHPMALTQKALKSLRGTMVLQY